MVEEVYVYVCNSILTHCIAHNHRRCQDTFDTHSSSRLLSKQPVLQPEAWSCELNRTVLKENSATYLYLFPTGAHNYMHYYEKAVIILFCSQFSYSPTHIVHKVQKGFVLLITGVNISNASS